MFSFSSRYQDWWPQKGPSDTLRGIFLQNLTSESVQGTALPLEGVDNVHGSDGLPLGMLGIGDGVTDDVLQEYLEHSTGLLVDEARDTLDTTSSSKTTDSGLGNTLDIIAKNFAMSLGAPLAQSLSSLAASSHDVQ